MSTRSKSLEAAFEQVLLYVDGPQVILLKADGSKVVAIAVEQPGYKYAFFGAMVSVDQFRDYLHERFDLRYLLMKPSLRRHYIFDLAKVIDGSVTMMKVSVDPDTFSRYLPDHGIFARDHTEEFVADLASEQTEETFGIDGSWDLPEFSQFYGQIADLYALFNGVILFSNSASTQKVRDRVARAFVKPFEGGSSYVSFYDMLSLVQSRSDRLRVGSIQYASPGHVAIRGSAAPFTEIRELIETFQNDRAHVAEEYRDLRLYLSKAKLLRGQSARFSLSSEVGRNVEVKAKRFSATLNAVDYDVLLSMAGGDVLVVAKILLSIFRRADRLYEFFLEGRASLPRTAEP